MALSGNKLLQLKCLLRHHVIPNYSISCLHNTNSAILTCVDKNSISSARNYTSQSDILTCRVSRNGQIFAVIQNRDVVCLLFSNTYCTVAREGKFDTSKPFAYYEILGVPRTAKQSEIKKAYFRMAKVYHPDVNPDEFARENFDKITEAYTCLMDLTQRYFYDRHGHSSEELKKRGTPSIFDWRPKYGVYEKSDNDSKEVEDWFTAQGHVRTEERISIRQWIKNAYVEYKYGMAYYNFPWNMKSFLMAFAAWIAVLVGFYFGALYVLGTVSFRKPIPIYLKYENDEIYDILWYSGARKSKPSDQSKGGLYHMPKKATQTKSEYSHTIYSNTRSRTKSKNLKKYRQLQKELKEARERSWTEEKIEKENKKRKRKNDGFHTQ